MSNDLVTIHSSVHFKDANACLSSYLFDRHNFKELAKKFHPDINSGASKEAFQRLLSLRKAYSESMHDCTFVPSTDVNSITIKQLLKSDIYGDCSIDSICATCDGLGFISNSNMVSKCDMCNGKGIRTIAKHMMLLSRGNLEAEGAISVENNLILISVKGCSFFINVTDAIVLSLTNRVALIVAGEGTCCKTKVGGDVYDAKCPKMVQLKLKSNVFSVYALTG